MGAVSSCCSAEPSENKETVHESGAGSGAAASYGEGGVSGSDVDSFRKRLERCMDVIVLLADGTRLACQFKFNSNDRSFVISCDTNKRVIPLTELKAVLSGREQLKRVETRAQLIDDPTCVALHMTSGNCIPIKFATALEPQCFIELVRQLKGPGGSI